MRNELATALQFILDSEPQAQAVVHGRTGFEEIQGNVYFYPFWDGTLVAAEISGLPKGQNVCHGHFFGFHVHDGKGCTGNASDPFADVHEHFNIYNCTHPNHTGDLPQLLADNGYALSIVYTDRFVPEEVIDRTIVIHQDPDDFTTPPSGHAGLKMACGEIKAAF